MKITYDIRTACPCAKFDGLEYLPNAVLMATMVPPMSFVGGYPSPMLVLLADRKDPISHRVFSCDLSTQLGDDDTFDQFIGRFVNEIAGEEIDVPEDFICDLQAWARRS